MTKNKDIRNFLRRPQPKADESISGYLIRLAEANGYCFRDIWNLFGFSNKNLQTKRPRAYIYGCADYSVLSQRTEIPTDNLKSLAFEPIQINSEQFVGTYKFFNNEIRSSMFRYKTSTVCPDCLTENAYQRKVWDLLAVTACPIHKRMLIDRCPKCGKAISYRRDRICFCTCGYDLRTAKSKLVSDEELRLASYIYQLCGLLPISENAAGKNIPIALSHLDLSGLLYSIFLVTGQIAAGGAIHGKILSRLTIEERHQLLSKALKVYDNFPENFFELLTFLKTNPNRPVEILKSISRKKLRAKLYERTVYLINKILTDSQFDFLRKALPEFLGREKLDFYGNNLDYTKTSAKEFFETHITLRQAVRYLNSSKNAVEEMIKTKVLKADKVAKSNNKFDYYINLQNLEQIKKRISELITLPDAARLIGLNIPQINILVDAGVIKVVEDVKLPISSRLVERRQALDLYKLFHKAMLKNPAYKVSGKKISSKKMLVTLGFVQINFGKMARMILDGKFAPAGRDKRKRINGFVYDEDQIKKTVELEIKKRTEGTLSFTEIPKILRAGKTVVQTLVQKKYFSVTDMKTVLGKRVSQNEFEQFQRDFILSGEIARRFSTTNRYVNQKLAAKNIFPVANVFDLHNYLYRRSDIKDVVIQKPDPKQWTYNNRRNNLLSLQDTAKRLELSEKDLMLAVERKLIYFSRNKYHRGVFSEAGIDSFRKLNLPHINFLREKEAAEMLGVRIKVFRKKYLNTGRIHPEVRSYRKNDNYRFYLIEDLKLLKAEMKKI